jgi:hypothetical protein
MNPPGNDLLLTAGKVLTLLMQGLMLVAGAAITFAFFGTIFLSDSINAELRLEFGPAIDDIPMASTLALLALALVAVSLVFVFFGKLRGIIATVAAGDPFVPENADRLTIMAWLMLAVYGVQVAIGLVAGVVSEWAAQFEDFHVNGTSALDLSALLLIIVLFILARVFRHGAAMRADLEGTV